MRLVAFRKRLICNSMRGEFMKRKIAFFLAAVTVATSIGALCISDRNKDILAATDDEIYYFAEGFGTGFSFDEDNSHWTIATNFDSGVTDTDFMNNSDNKAGIVENNHSSAHEPVIRLINGADNDPSVTGASDYRGGSAMAAEKIMLNKDSEFSAKFTISMPDARVNSAQTNGEVNAREVGGDGIAFIITTTDNVQGQAGGGIGYYGVNNSIVVELDSYFNGAYCDLASTSTSYVNWKFDNQIYADENLNCIRAAITTLDYDNGDYSSEYDYGAYWDNVLNPAHYKAIPTNVGRFDHVGVMIDGNPLNHIGVAYLNAKDPTEVVGGVYVNLDSDTSNDVTVSSYSAVSDSFTGFTDTDVDDRLFTFWIEYDGTDLYVSYAVGDFVNAERPATPQIAVKGNSALANKFANQEVNIGFTSAIGSSKANHTVHSVMFVNDYIEGGIPDTTSYTEKYYVEVPAATDDSITITVDGTDKYYELFESVTKSEVSLGESVTIREADKNTDLTKTLDSSRYTEADYTKTAYSSYSQTDTEVNADGSTVLYRFYDGVPYYTVYYYLEDDTASDLTVGDKTYKLQENVVYTANKGDNVALSYSQDNSESYITVGDVTKAGSNKSYTNYVVDTDSTDTYNYKTVSVAGFRDDYKIVVLYTKKSVNYTEKYYVEDSSATSGYIEITDNGEVIKYRLDKTTTKSAVVGSEVDIEDLSADYSDYNEVTYSNYPGSADSVNEDGSTVLYQFFTKEKVTTYTVKYCVEIDPSEADASSIKIGDKYYKIIEGETIVKSEVEGTDISTSVNNGVAGIVAGNTDVTDTFKNLAGYIFDNDATQAHGKSYGIVLPDGSLEIVLVYNLAADTNPPAGKGAVAGAAAIMALAGIGVLLVLKKRK